MLLIFNSLKIGSGYMNKCIDKFNQKIIKLLPIIILTFIIFQPILDLITSLEVNIIHTNFSIGSVIRFLFMMFSSYYILFISDNKKYKILTIITYIYLISFAFMVILLKDFNVILFEGRNALNTFYLPIVLISLYLMHKNNHLSINMNYIIITYLIYILFIMVPNLFNLGYKSYSEAKVGSTGWFFSANAIGNILCMLLPFIFYYLIKFKINIIVKIITFISICYVFASMGTKVPILGFGICFLVNFIYFFIKWIKDKKYILVSSSIGVMIIGIIGVIILLPKTSFYKNIQIHKEYLGFNHYYEVFTKPKLTDHFIFSQRLTFLKNSHHNFIKTKPVEKLLGMGYIENYATDDLSTKTIEMDYFEVFYRHGFIGCIIFYIIMIPLFITCIKTKNNKSLLKTEFITSFILMLLLGLFSGHIFIMPSVSIYVAIILIIYLSKDNFNRTKINE